ncbi:MAG: hypothetical protein Q9165_001382 [Trypethelium subeluteriae]
MSGNPFRHSIHVNTTLSAPNADLSEAAEKFPDIQDADFEAQPRKTKKTVRITSPPKSPPSPNPPGDGSLAQRVTPERYSGSPPPAIDGSSDSDTPTDDPFEKPLDETDDSAKDDAFPPGTRHNSSRMVSMSPQVMPQNPFQRTLASIEPSGPQQGSPRGGGDISEKSVNPSGKGAMDVDSFTRLLLTGNARTRTTAPSATPPNPRSGLGSVHVDSSSSSTDTSSISRHSIFDSTHDAHQESPRTSYEQSDSEGDEPDEKSSLTGTQKVKPPPPKPRHGKPVSQREPQTVSFSDFAPSILSPDSPQSPSQPSTPRVNSDLNKPLPPPPPYSTSPEQKPSVPWPETPDEALRSPITEPVSSPRRSVDPSTSSSQKKQAPPVPLARRHSQLRSNAQNRSRSNSSLTLPSQPEETEDDDKSTLPPASAAHSSSKAPPPPPARRVGASKLPPSPVGFSAEPSPSPRPSRSGSSSSAQRPHRASNASSSSGIAPPPPPPRKGMSRATQEGRRSSLASMTEAPQRSVEEPVTSAVTSPPAEEVMKSMEDFQREIDALLAKAEK